MTVKYSYFYVTMHLTLQSIEKAISGQTKYIGMWLGTNIIFFEANSSISMLKIKYTLNSFAKSVLSCQHIERVFPTIHSEEGECLVQSHWSQGKMLLPNKYSVLLPPAFNLWDLYDALFFFFFFPPCKYLRPLCFASIVLPDRKSVV